jgi:hypothetical protein
MVCQNKMTLQPLDNTSRRSLLDVVRLLCHEKEILFVIIQDSQVKRPKRILPEIELLRAHASPSSFSNMSAHTLCKVIAAILFMNLVSRRIFDFRLGASDGGHIEGVREITWDRPLWALSQCRWWPICGMISPPDRWVATRPQTPSDQYLRQSPRRRERLPQMSVLREV